MKIRLIPHIILLLIFITFTAICHAQSSIFFDHVVDLGVPGGQTFLQDNDGFLWIGSDGGGMFRYDGYGLKNFGAGPKSLSNGNVWRIIEDHQNPDIFWIGTSGGLHRFDKSDESFTVYTHDPNNPESIGNNTIQDIVPDRSDPDILWLGTSGGGLNRFNKVTGVCKRYEHDADDPDSIIFSDVWRLMADREEPHILWIGTYGGGLDRFDKHTEKFTHFIHDPNDPHSLSAKGNNVDAIIQDKDDPNILWIGTPEDGMDKFDKRTQTFTNYGSELTYGEVALIYDDGNGKLWLGGYVQNNGLTIFDKSTETFSNYKNQPDDPHSLGDDLVVNVYLDRAGIFWITTYSGKIDKIDPNKSNFGMYQHNQTHANSLSNSAVTTIYEDRNDIVWFGTQGGLNALNRQTGEFTRYIHDENDPDSLDVDYVLSIFEDSSQSFWVSLYVGPLTKFDRTTGKVIARYKTDAESFTQIVEDKKNPDILWIGTHMAGLAKFDKSSESFTFFLPDASQPHKGPNNSYVQVLFQDRDEDVIWLGGYFGGGLSKFDTIHEAFTHYVSDPQNPNSLSADAISAIYQDSKKTLWIGTKGGGLNKFDKTSGKFAHYTKKIGVPMEVNAILEQDNGNLWLSSDLGIYEFNPSTEIIERHYNQSDGLQGDAFLHGSAEKTGDGKLWFGGTQGVNHFRPDQLTRNHYAPPVVLTSLTQGGEKFTANVPYRINEIRLDWRKNFFEFEYTALNYTIPAKNQYRYMLEGFDSHWYYAGERRFGRYSNIPGGTYTLRIAASNNDGIWSNHQVELKITVLPPLWFNPWFIGSIVCLIILMLAGGFSWRFYDIKKQNRLLETQVAERTSELRESERALKTLIRNLPGIAYRCRNDRNWTMEFISNGCHVLTGYPAEAFVDNTELVFADIIHPDDRQQLWDNVQDALKDRRMFQVVFRIITKDGQQKWLWGQGQGVYDENENLIALEGLINDITDHKETEFALQEAKEKAEVANHAKSAFLANMSHELRSPLTAILGFSQIIERCEALPENQRENLSIVHRSAEHLLSLINQVLDLSKVEAGRITLDEKDFNLYRLLDEVEDMFQLKAENKRLTLTFERDSIIPQFVHGDEVKVRQVLINLLNNAIKFTETGGVILRISSGEMLHIEIEDTGPGISEDELEVLFDAFVQTESGRKSQQGTGLGLHITRKFIRLMGGDIAISSQVGKGTKFSFDIRLKPAEFITDDNFRQTDRRVLSLEPGQPVYRILIVDDNVNNRLLLKNILTSIGFEVREAADGDQGIRVWQEWHPHAIFMDVRMPLMDGYEATRRIRVMEAQGYETELDSVIHIPIIALTASVFENERDAVLAAGCDDFMRKPFHENDIFDMLTKHIGATYLTQEGEPPKDASETLNAANEFQKLPLCLLDDLEQAASGLDVMMVEDIIGTIQPEHPELAEKLFSLAETFEYTKIISLIQESRNLSGK